MNCEISNLTRRLVLIHCNSGKTYHLPPGYTHELPEQEVVKNASIQKLQNKKLISIKKHTSQSGPAKPATTKEEAGPAKTETTKKKSQAAK